MRNFAFLVLALSFQVLADTPGDFVGEAKNGVGFEIVLDSAPYADENQQFLKPQFIYRYRQRLQEGVSVRFDEQKLPSNCLLSAALDHLSCSKSPNTPLSGVRYELNQQKFRKQEILELKCVKGCSDAVPAAFVYVSQSGFVP